MKYIKQLAIIITISLIGEILAEILPFTIPASVYGLFVMLLALVTKVLKVEQVKETSDFLMDIMPIMFVPASVGLMVSWGLLKEILVPVLIVSVLGTLIVMIVSGKSVDILMGLTGKKTVATDGISVDGEIIDEGQYEENAIAMKQGGGDVGKETPEQTEKIASTMNREISKDYHVDNEIKEGGNHE
ncbi:MAG: CidA/LrgA family protein [Lachnospiraceae bacterium]|nr:CidA/LrgA family protein [Lachnospiraceae bacterium]